MTHVRKHKEYVEILSRGSYAIIENTPQPDSEILSTTIHTWHLNLQMHLDYVSRPPSY